MTAPPNHALDTSTDERRSVAFPTPPRICFPGGDVHFANRGREARNPRGRRGGNLRNRTTVEMTECAVCIPAPGRGAWVVRPLRAHDPSMPFEFDHVFICVDRGGPEASRLSAFGLTEGSPNAHPGQGTACRRFFFANFYVELLWVCSESEAGAEVIRPTRLRERWEGRGRGFCPFGFGFRPKTKETGDVPFCSWEYRPPYLPAPLSIQIATNSNVPSEPMLFYLSFAQRPDAYPPAKQQPLAHRAGLREVTRVTLFRPCAEDLSPAMAVVTRGGPAQLHTGSEYLLELGFDGELQGERRQFGPLLPLAFCW
jgi:hypothetical protein